MCVWVKNYAFVMRSCSLFIHCFLRLLSYARFDDIVDIVKIEFSYRFTHELSKTFLNIRWEIVRCSTQFFFYRANCCGFLAMTSIENRCDEPGRQTEISLWCRRGKKGVEEFDKMSFRHFLACRRRKTIRRKFNLCVNAHLSIKW